MLNHIKRLSLILFFAGLSSQVSVFSGNEGSNGNAGILQRNQKVTGKVQDAMGPIAGASVIIKGTTAGTTSDANGNFSLEVSNGESILVSFIGYTPQEVRYTGQSSINVTLVDDTKLIDEVVVTALGIKREKKALGYATQELKGDALIESRENNLANALSGKVSGLQVIRSSNGPAGSSKIVLRGNSSLTGSNQPLIVVDGIPMDNFTGGVSDVFGNEGPDKGSGIADINPEDIESLNVLKGASAAALYGSRAGNGVILITTKSGKKQTGLGITVNAGISTENIFLKPKLQDIFGQGSSNIYDVKSRSSWGPVANGSENIERWDKKTVPFRTFDNIGNYFNSGVSYNEGISFQQSANGASIFASINRSDDKGVVPGAKLDKTSFTLRGTTEFGSNKQWKFDTKVNYINNNATNRPIQGINQSNAFRTIYFLPRSIDITLLENSVDKDGKMIWWDTQKTPQENPYWIAKYRTNEDTRNRLLGSMSLSYQITDWWGLELKGGTDYYTTNTTSKLYAGGNVRPKGYYAGSTETFYENNYSFLSTFKKDNLIDKLGGFVTFGGNLMSQNRKYTSFNTGDLAIPNLFSISNSTNKLDVSVDNSEVRRKMNSLYGALQMNWDGWLFMDVTGRNDWSSTMSKENRSYFYPSVSLSAVISDMIGKSGGTMPEWMTFAKTRVSYAEVGNDLDPYQLYTVYSIGKDPNGNPTISPGSTLFDPSVRSELIKSWEAGLDLKFFNNRLGIDISWYKSNATRQLFNLPLDPFTGYSSRKINAGNIQNSGIEMMIYGSILHNPRGLNWDMTVNASSNRNKIIDLYKDVNEYGLRTFDDVKIVARTGSYYGDIYGKKFQRVENGEHAGKILVDAEGLPLLTSSQYKLGNQQPDFLLGITNSFNYKNISLSFLVDARIGGEIFSGTTAGLYASGNAAGTVVNGKRENFVVPNTVVANPDGSYTANQKTTTPQQYWERVAGSGNVGLGEAFTYDATNIRLRNITLGYDFNKKLLAKTPIQRLRLSLTANNLWMIKYHLEGIDPESVVATNTNASGFEYGSAPTSRTFAFNITVGF